MTIFLQVFYVIFSAILESLAIPNEFFLFGSPFLGLFALCPLYLALAQARSFRQAGIYISLHLTLTHLMSSFWLGYFKDFAAFTLGGTVAYYTLLGFFLGKLFYLPFWYTNKTRLNECTAYHLGVCSSSNNVFLRVLLFASLWTLYEWYKSLGFLAYPWVTILMTSWKWPLITQIVSITGTWGLSFLFSLFSAVIAEGISLLSIQSPTNLLNKKLLNSSKYPSYTYVCAFCVVLFICTLFQGIYEYTKVRTPIKTINTVIVQTDSDSWLTLNDEDAILKGQELTKKAIDESGKDADIVLWTEAILSTYYPRGEYIYQMYPREKPLVDFIRETNTPFIIGAPVEINQEKSLETGMRYFNNSALYFDQYGNWLDFYGKIQLVPFAEVIPYADNKLVQNFMQAVVGFSSGWTPGEFFKTFDIPTKNNETVTVSTPICFEDAFPYICRALFFEGSEAFFNLTNDSWSQTNSAEIQHFVISSFRAQEFRTTLVRSTNSGFSVVTDPAGKILYSLPLFESVAGAYDVPIYEREVTLYAIAGDWFVYTILAAYFFIVIFIYNKTRKEL